MHLAQFDSILYVNPMNEIDSANMFYWHIGRDRQRERQKKRQKNKNNKRLEYFQFIRLAFQDFSIGKIKITLSISFWMNDREKWVTCSQLSAYTNLIPSFLPTNFSNWQLRWIWSYRLLILILHPQDYPQVSLTFFLLFTSSHLTNSIFRPFKCFLPKRISVRFSETWVFTRLISFRTFLPMSLSMALCKPESMVDSKHP